MLDEFRQALDDCRALYEGAARRCAEAGLLPAGKTAREFAALMLDLHKGMLSKVYVTLATADRRWSAGEREQAEILFEHLWDRRLTGSALRAAAVQLCETAGELKWYSLVRPFDEIAPLRDLVGDLEAVVMRAANLVARADGELHPSEQKHLRSLQEELRRHLRHIPLDEPGHHAEARQTGARAVESVIDVAPHIREQCHLDKIELPDVATTGEERVDEALARLDALIGLGSVKREVRTLVNFLKVQSARREAGLPETELSLHMVFTGNPGTGKTTVARIVGQIFGAMGILQSGHLIETDRSGLVAEYSGQTGPRTHSKIDEALDGVLFIDEAYSLIAERDDPYGHEAVQALLKRAEDDRERLVVILAGYPEPIDELIRSNPGLSSRFSRRLQFADYMPSELARIFGRFCAAGHYELTPEARLRLLWGLDWLYRHRDSHFGNGRTVRNLFEATVRQHANRIADLSPLTREQLCTLTDDDMHIRGVPAEHFADLDPRQVRLDVDCPGCGREADMRATYLGRGVKCNKCGEKFIAEWGEVSGSDE